MNTSTHIMPEPIILLLRDLRSGKYKQRTGRLGGVDDGYCCLGVACCTARDNGIDVVQNNGTLEGTSLKEQVNVLKWLNLSKPHGGFRGSNFKGQHSLANLNDVAKLNFYEIADFIESRWQDLVILEEK